VRPRNAPFTIRETDAPEDVAAFVALLDPNAGTRDPTLRVARIQAPEAATSRPV
jgi:hypothetical protein